MAEDDGDEDEGNHHEDESDCQENLTKKASY